MLAGGSVRGFGFCVLAGFWGAFGALFLPYGASFGVGGLVFLRAFGALWPLAWGSEGGFVFGGDNHCFDSN